MVKLYSELEIANVLIQAYNRNLSGYIKSYVGSGVYSGVNEGIEAILEQDKNAKILVLCRTKATTAQLIEKLGKHQTCHSFNDRKCGRLVITTYEDYLSRKIDVLFDLIVCDDAYILDSSKYYTLVNQYRKSLIGLMPNTTIEKTNIFYEKNCLYINIPRGFAHREYDYINNLISPLLIGLDFKDIEIQPITSAKNKIIRHDIVAKKGNSTYYFDFFMYRGIFNDKTNTQNAIERIKLDKDELNINNTNYCAIFFCIIDENTKQEIKKENNIIIWDIKNLIYLCNKLGELSKTLDSLSPYSLNLISPVPPLDFHEITPITSSSKQNNIEDNLIQDLKCCPTGSSAWQEFEEVCRVIIRHLFPSEFSQIKSQSWTEDKLFRRDIICALKGTTAFWDFLIKFYNTKFVVFECKNYSDKVKQNDVFITDKYLFAPALRKVAFIISRKGFSDSAKKSAEGILIEQGKLIIDLTDDDLSIMLECKKRGEEPSDYLLNKVENLLMSISI